MGEWVGGRVCTRTRVRQVFALALDAKFTKFSVLAEANLPLADYIPYTYRWTPRRGRFR